MTKQQLSVAVPFSGTTLQMGAAAGGDGISLVTAKDVLFDSVGVFDIQSKGKFTAQTNGGMKMLSAALHKVHSGGKVEIYAGGGSNPGDCSAGSPASATDTGKPGAKTEILANATCGALSGYKAWQDLSSALTGAQGDLSMGEAVGAAAGVMKGLCDVGKVIPGMLGHIKEASQVGSGFDAASGALGVIGGLAKGDFGSVASGISSMITGGAGLSKGSGPGGSSADIEERAAANIKMVAAKKISGCAPLGIDSKTPGKFEVKSLLLTEFTTTSFANYALAKFEVKSLVFIKTSSSTFEVDAKATAKIETPAYTQKATMITHDGFTHITGSTIVDGKTTIRKKLDVTSNTIMKGKLTVDGNVDIKGQWIVEQDVTVKRDVTIANKVTVRQMQAKSRVTFIPG
ncbi:MAG: hypothetical protein JNK72_19710 [Myxococcales bacterium]|nr:hypothetical protein [Myxococcales bacterium]